MNQQEFVLFLESWFKGHGKKESELPVGAEECREWTTLAGIPLGSKLYFYKALETPGYPTVWGYFCEAGGKLSCRHFYKSASEAAWRAGTGIRYDGGWVKSAERVAEQKDISGNVVIQGHESGGYIFEGMVPNKLDQALDTYYAKHDSNVGREWRNHREWPVSIQNLKNYFVAPKTGLITDPGHIQTLYAKERKYVPAIPQNIRDGKAFDYKEGSVALQKDLQVGTKLKGTTGGMGKAHELKKYTPLWDWINQCLNNPTQPTITGRRHDILNETHSIHTYRLDGCEGKKSAMIEVAQTDASKNLSYVTPSGITIQAHTPICWIRSAYMLPETITSFGTYKYCPIDLAFLVQKPCDYVSQTSMDEANRLDVKTQKDRQGKLAFSSGPKQTETGRMHIIQKGGQDTYLMLALFNENTSPLLKQYKIKNNLSRFRHKYWQLPGIAKDIAKDHETLRILAVQGIYEYLSFQININKKGTVEKGHGKTGIKRAEMFFDRITAPNYDTAANLLNDTYQLFAKDKVNGVSCGGWFEGIGTKPNSLFTLCIRNILAYYLQGEIARELIEQAAPKKMKDFPGPANGITRALVKAIQLQTKKVENESTEAFLTRHSSDLLDALRS